MIHCERMKYPEHVYPADPWRMVEKRFYPRFMAQTESLFATGNGYLGMRGNFEEGSPAHENGTFVNGFYESWPIVYGEEAYGFAKMGHAYDSGWRTKYHRGQGDRIDAQIQQRASAQLGLEQAVQRIKVYQKAKVGHEHLHIANQPVRQ